MLDDSLFDDPARLLETDVRGLLRSAALAGAQVRATAEDTASAGLAQFVDQRPRALVLLTPPDISGSVCRVLAALLGSSCPVPVVLADSAPSWVGALDVVFGHTDEVSDPAMAESVDRACRRGATVVLAAPTDGPVAAAAAGRAIVLPPRVPVPPALSFPHVFTVGSVLLHALGLLRVDTEVLADELDGAAERAHPNHDLVVNPAKSLALRLADRVPVLWGLDPVSTAVAGHGASVIGTHAGVACAVDDHQRARTQHALVHAARGLGAEESLFADPEDEVGARMRVLLVGVGCDEQAMAAERAAVAELPAADLVTPGESVHADAALRAALLASRFDLASVYLGLAAGTLSGPGWQTLAAR